jgi:hypothetical protein
VIRPHLFQAPDAEPETACDSASVAEGGNELPPSGGLDQRLVSPVDYFGRVNLPGGVDNEFHHFTCRRGVLLRRWRRATQQNGPGLNERRFGRRSIRCTALGSIANNDSSADRIIDLRPIPASRRSARVIKVVQDSALVDG